MLDINQDRELPEAHRIRVSIAGKGDGVQTRFRTFCGQVIGITVKLDRGEVVSVAPDQVRAINAPLPANVVVLRRRA